MRMIDIISKKRDGEALSADEIRHFVQAYTAGTIPDYQVSALLMAIVFQGMDRGEIVALTIAMAESGDMLDLSDILDYALDKHSSGGVGDIAEWIDVEGTDHARVEAFEVEHPDVFVQARDRL